MPTLYQFMAHILRVMQDGNIRHISNIIPLVCERAQLTGEQMAAIYPTGERVVVKRIRWGCWYFRQAGIFDQTAPATYQITALGREKAVEWQDLGAITLNHFVGLSVWDAYRENVNTIAQQQPDEAEAAVNLEESEVAALQAVTAITENTTQELLERLRNVSPESFEKIVIQVLLAMGYGGRENLFEHLGRSHDGGIDGVIKQDPLGIQKIYIQAKRYAEDNNISNGTVQAFVGALHGRGAGHGVFITTSSFTQAARDYAAGLLGQIVLIDGRELASMMVRYKVGIQVRQTLEIIQIDEDFFGMF